MQSLEEQCCGADTILTGCPVPFYAAAPDDIKNTLMKIVLLF